MARLELSDADRAALLDRISALDSATSNIAAASGTPASGKALFPPHLPLEQILRLVRTGRLMQGTYIQSRENYLEGNVQVENFVEKVPKTRTYPHIRYMCTRSCEM